MDEPYIGEIRAIAGNYAPKGWAFCNGQILPINQNQALYSVLGVTYGGNGTTTFALPNLQSRVPVGSGQLPGGQEYSLGAQLGVDSVTLNQTQIPAHLHQIVGTIQPGVTPADDQSPAGNYPSGGGRNMYSTGPKNATLGPPNSVSGNTSSQGGSQSHDNHQPYLATNFVIALKGIFPSRS